MRSSKIREESCRLKKTCCHLNSSEKPSDNADEKNSQGVNNNEENLPNSGFAVPVDHKVRSKENEKKKKQVLRPCQRTEKVVEHEGDSDTC